MQTHIINPDPEEYVDVETNAATTSSNSAYLKFFMDKIDAGNDEDEFTNDEEDDCDSDINSPASDESEWGTVKENFDVNAVLEDSQESVSDEDVKPLYIPEPVHTMNDIKKIQVPQLPIAKVPVGCRVWVSDEEDVELLLHNHWDVFYRTVCNGRMCGTVVRHSGNLTLVAFYDEGLEIQFSLSLPRACLSITPIDAYENSTKKSKTFISPLFELCNSNISPVPNCRDTRPQHFRQFYECLSVLDVQMMPAIAFSQDCVLSGDFEGALRLIDEQLSGVGTESVSYRVDLLTLRSRVLVFLGQYEDALRSALDVIELQPNWVKGYLCAARALSGKGDYAVAAAHIQRVSLLLPHSQAVRKVENLTMFLAVLQDELPCNTLKLSMDFRYAKQLVAYRAFDKNEVLCSEERAILAMPDIFADSEKLTGYCPVCFKPATDVTRSPVNFFPNSGYTNDIKGKYFCSLECEQRSRLFLPIEQCRHRIVMERARDFIRSKCTPTVKQVPLNLAYMTAQLFLIVCATHDRLLLERRQQLQSPHIDDDRAAMSLDDTVQSAGSDCMDSVVLQAALQELGVYPLLTSQLLSSEHGEIKVVYDTLTSFWDEEERERYSLVFFCALYEYVRNSAVCAELPVREPTTEGSLLVYYLTKFIGAARRVDPGMANCTLSVEDGTTRINLLATKDISAGETISIPW